MATNKLPYELSAWDVTKSTSDSYFSENKICTLSSDDMLAPYKAYDITLTTNVNGSNTLKFTIPFRFFNEEIGEYELSPFLKFLVNERRIKLHYKNQWYDFLIKSIDESSSDDTISYECTDAFINELSKIGYEVELSNDLQNNQGTVTQLAAKILENTDWVVDEDNSDNLPQLNKEALYEVVLSSNLTNFTKIAGDESLTSIAAGKTILVFADSILNKQDIMQFIYLDSGNYETDDERLITNGSNYYISGMTYNDTTSLPSIGSSISLSQDYRGKRYVRKEQTGYDPILKQYITKLSKVGDASGDVYYRYAETNYSVSDYVVDYIASGTNFDSLDGWQQYDSINTAVALKTLTKNNVLVPYITTNQCNASRPLMNTGLMSGSNLELNKGAIWELRIQTIAAESSLRCKIVALNTSLGLSGSETIWDSGNFSTSAYTAGSYKTITSNILIGKTKEQIETLISGGRLVFTISNTSSETDYGFSFACIQLFPVYKNSGGVVILPSDAPVASTNTKYYIYPQPDASITSSDQIAYSYTGENALGLENTEFQVLYNSDDNKYTQVRSIESSDSNCYNGIQSLAETFQCFPILEIAHDEDGKISTTTQDTKQIEFTDNGTYIQTKYSCKKILSFYVNGVECKTYTTAVQSDGTARISPTGISPLLGMEVAYTTDAVTKVVQDKKVKFKQYSADTKNYAGFKYGINLQNIQRTIDSSEIVTRLIVKDNSDESATNGFCSISRASQNAPHVNFLYDFKYYVNQGLISYETVNSDLYDLSNGLISQIINLSKDYEETTTKLSNTSLAITTAKAKLQVAEAGITAATQSLNDAISDFKGVYGNVLVAPKPYAAAPTYVYSATGTLTSDETSDLAAINIYYKNIDNFKADQATYAQAIKDNTDILDTINGLQHYRQVKIAQLVHNFNKIYGSYIQEGSWNSDDYIDDNLYYLDAVSILETSAIPKTTYEITVAEVEGVEDFSNYKFSVGDITYVEDTEFFGWITKDGIKTPFKQEVVITEITQNLTDPTQNTITVQNYKNQFESLFQQITATIQDVQYSSGIYDKASAVVDSSGNIVGTALSKALNSDDVSITNTTNGSISFGSQGLVTYDVNNHSNQMRISNGSIFTSSDSGQTWSKIADASGLSLSQLSTNTLTASNIQIVTGPDQQLMWDSDGIKSYSLDYGVTDTVYDDNGIVTTKGVRQYNKYVQLDSYGLYGVVSSNFSLPKVKQYSSISTYKVGDCVLVSNVVYQCINAITAGQEWTASNWKDISYNSSNNYAVNDVCAYNSNLYRCISATTGTWDLTKWTNYPLTYIKDNAQFGLTWDGFFLNSTNGSVTISSNNDIQVFNKDTQGNKNEVIKLGLLDDNTYGLLVKDTTGNKTAFKTNSNGYLEVGGATNVKIGQLESISDSEYKVFEVTKTTDNTTSTPFYITNEGALFASNATISGTITAETLIAGQVTADDFIKTSKTLTLNLTNETCMIPTDSIGDGGDFANCKTQIKVTYGSTDVTSTCSFDFITSWEEDTTNPQSSWNSSTYTYTVSRLDVDSGYVDITITYNSMTATKRFSIVKQKQGTDAAMIYIHSSAGTAFKNSNISTVLTVTVYYGGVSITDQATLEKYFGVGAYIQWSIKNYNSESYVIISSSDTKLSNNGWTYTLGPSDIDTQAVFALELIVPD